MIKLVIDSTSYIEKEYAQKHDIKVVNLNTTINDYSIEEGFEDNWNTFFDKLKNSKDFPKTSQPTPAEFEGVYNEILLKNPETEIITITLSQSLSGTYNSARLAAENVNKNKIFVIDSGQTAQSQLLFLEQIIELIEQGKTAKEIFDMQENLRKSVCIQFVPQTMEYLKRGGRIDLLSATIASVLNIKPILSFKNGKLENTKKCLGMQKAISEMVAEIPKTVKKIYVCYIHEAEWTQKLMDKVNQAFNFGITQAKKIGPVIGSHIGIGAVGLAYLLPIA